MLRKLQLQKCLDHLAMLGAIICSLDIQKHTVQGLLQPFMMMGQMLQHEQVVERASLGQETSLPGEGIPMLCTVLGVGLMDSTANAVGIDLVEDRRHRDGPVVGTEGQVVALVHWVEEGNIHQGRLRASSVDRTEEVLKKGPDRQGCQHRDWDTRLARGGTPAQTTEGITDSIIIEDGGQLLGGGRGQFWQLCGARACKHLGEVRCEVSGCGDHRRGLGQASSQGAPKVGRVLGAELLKVLVLPIGILALFSLEQGPELAALQTGCRGSPPSPVGCLALSTKPRLMHPPAAGLG